MSLSGKSYCGAGTSSCQWDLSKLNSPLRKLCQSLGPQPGWPDRDFGWPFSGSTQTSLSSHCPGSNGSCGFSLEPGSGRWWLWRASSLPSSAAPLRTPALLPPQGGLLLLAQPSCGSPAGQAMEELPCRHLGRSWGSRLPLPSLSRDANKELEGAAGLSTLVQGRDCSTEGPQHPLKKRPSSPQAPQEATPPAVLGGHPTLK